MDNPLLYLASRSPRRRTLIEQLGVSYRTVDVDIDEKPRDGEDPADYVGRLALEKARAGWHLVSKEKIPVVAADTCIVLNDRIVGKVENRQASIALLQQYSAASHQVYTGLAMVGNSRAKEKNADQKGAITQLDTKERVCVNISKIIFRTLTEQECEDYWDTGEPLGKAGGYAIQGVAAAFIERIEGSYSAVVGLPLCELSTLMSEFGVQWFGQNNNNRQAWKK